MDCVISEWTRVLIRLWNGGEIISSLVLLLYHCLIYDLAQNQIYFTLFVMYFFYSFLISFV